jgi:hypothetical protein
MPPSYPICRSLPTRFRDNADLNTDAEKASKAKALLIFATSQQQTWLVASREKLYCVLDDMKDDPKIWWDLKINVSPNGDISFLTTASLPPPEGEPVLIDFEDRSGKAAHFKSGAPVSKNLSRSGYIQRSCLRLLPFKKTSALT